MHYSTISNDRIIHNRVFVYKLLYNLVTIVRQSIRKNEYLSAGNFQSILSYTRTVYYEIILNVA